MLDDDGMSLSRGLYVPFCKHACTWMCIFIISRQTVSSSLDPVGCRAWFGKTGSPKLKSPASL